MVPNIATLVCGNDYRYSTLGRKPEGSLISYGFSRPLTEFEWDILRRYTRRVRSLGDDCGLGRKSIQILSLTVEPLFPNLRHLKCKYTRKTAPLLLLPFPFLTSLDVDVANLRLFPTFVKSFIKFLPNLRKLSIHVYELEVRCMDALTHLSCMCALTRLDLGFTNMLPIPSDPPLVLPNIHYLTLNCPFLEPTSRFLSQTQLRSIKYFYVTIEDCPSREELSRFFDSVQASGFGHVVKRFKLDQNVFLSDIISRNVRTVLGLEDLRPLLAFSKLHHVKLNIPWKVGLTDADLLTLASAWPRLKHLLINEDWGWSTRGGITPNGLLRLLQRCRWLYRVALAIDTRGFTELPLSSASLGTTFRPRWFYIDILDSVIEAESVPAIATFFIGITPRSFPLICAWMGHGMGVPETVSQVYRDRWDDTYRRVILRD